MFVCNRNERRIRLFAVFDTESQKDVCSIQSILPVKNTASSSGVVAKLAATKPLLKSITVINSEETNGIVVYDTTMRSSESMNSNSNINMNVNLVEGGNMGGVNNFKNGSGVFYLLPPSQRKSPHVLDSRGAASQCSSVVTATCELIIARIEGLMTYSVSK